MTLHDYVPHRPPMLLLDELVTEREDQVVCRATVAEAWPFCEAGEVNPLVMIELVAQACAVYVGVRARREGNPPQVGMLVGCREAELLAPRLVVGDELTITARPLFGQVQVTAFEGTVHRGAELCARMTLSVVAAAAAPAGELTS